MGSNPGMALHHGGPFGLSYTAIKNSLKVPKCEIFYFFDFNDVYVTKSLQIGDFRDKIKN
jgi:hypothetical protein